MYLIYLSSLILPLLILIIIIYAINKKINVYEVFINGAKDGIEMSINIFPYLLGMIMAVNILLKVILLMIYFLYLNQSLFFKNTN